MTSRTLLLTSSKYMVRINPPIDSSRRFAPAPNTSASVSITIATQFSLNVERPVKLVHAPPSTRWEVQSGVDTTISLLNRSQPNWISFASAGH